MGMVCQLRQVNTDYARKLLDNPNEILEYVEDAEEGELTGEAQGEDLDLDKAWHGLHYLLTGTAWEGQVPNCYLVIGGQQVGNEEEHDGGYGPAHVLSPLEVVAFSKVVQVLTPDEISRRLNPQQMTEMQIYPEI